MAEVLDQSKDREKNLQKEASGQPEEKVVIGALESAIAAVEEDLDVQATKTAKAEAVADLAEFDENIPVEDADGEETQISKAELEVQNIVAQVNFFSLLHNCLFYFIFYQYISSFSLPTTNLFL